MKFQSADFDQLFDLMDKIPHKKAIQLEEISLN